MKYAAGLFLALVILFAEPGCGMQQTDHDNQQGTGSEKQAADQEAPSNVNLHGKTIDIPLKGMPIHVYGLKVVGQDKPDDIRSEWVAVLNDGRLQRFDVHLNNGKVEEITSGITPLSPSIPHFIKPAKMQIKADGFPPGEASRWTTPLTVGEDLQVFVDPNGDVVFWKNCEVARLSVHALPDTRILIDDHERLLVLNAPVNRYQHGILGDKTEAGGFVIIDAKSMKVIHSVTIDPPDVIESLQPIWADWDGDGEREVDLTLSNNNTGSRLALFSEAGKLLAQGPPIGKGHRWRDALTIAPFGPDGRRELAEVITPHIGGILQYVYWDKAHGALKPAASADHYSTHDIGTRNLDLFAAADWDRDGTPELLLPNQSKSGLAVVKRTTAGIQQIASFVLNGKLSTNISVLAIQQDAGTQSIAAAGTKEGILKLWFN